MYYNQFMTEYTSQFISSDGSRPLIYTGTGVLNMVNNPLYLGVDPATIAELESQEIVIQQNEEVMETENIEIIEENPVTLEPLIPENSGTILMDEYTSRFNGAIWYDKVQQLSKQHVNNVLFGIDSINAQITADEDGYVLLSVPYAEGWKAKVDGKTVEILRANEEYMAFKLHKGKHELQLNYSTP